VLRYGRNVLGLRRKRTLDLFGVVKGVGRQSRKPLGRGSGGIGDDRKRLTFVAIHRNRNLARLPIMTGPVVSRISATSLPSRLNRARVSSRYSFGSYSTLRNAHRCSTHPSLGAL
jgi:hypothetical protein